MREKEKPTPEEVALEMFKRWYEYERFDVFTDPNKVSYRLDCGIVSVSAIRTPIGPLIHISPNGKRIAVDDWNVSGDGFFHILGRLHSFKEDPMLKFPLPDDFNEWFLHTIDRMYGWNE